MKKLVLALIMVFTIGLLLSCDDTDDEDSSIYNFKVISSGGGFYGFYIVDGGDVIDFVDSGLSGSYYTFERSLDNPVTLFVRADADDLDVNGDPSETQYIEIQVYENDELVNSITDNKYVDEHLGIFLDHDFTDNDSEE